MFALLLFHRPYIWTSVSEEKNILVGSATAFWCSVTEAIQVRGGSATMPPASVNRLAQTCYGSISEPQALITRGVYVPIPKSCNDGILLLMKSLCIVPLDSRDVKAQVGRARRRQL